MEKMACLPLWWVIIVIVLCLIFHLLKAAKKYFTERPLSDEDVNWDDNGPLLARRFTKDGGEILPPMEIRPYRDQGGGAAQDRYNKLKQELRVFEEKTHNESHRFS